MRSAGRSLTELDGERLREAPRTKQAPSLRDATRVAASVPLPDGLRPPERLYFHPNKEQMTLSICCAARPAIATPTKNSVLLSHCVLTCLASRFPHPQ